MFYPAAKIVLKHPTEQNKLLLIKRSINGSVYYEPIGGRAEVDFKSRHAETLEECVLREAREELGITVSIERYIGSYYFFWTVASHACSSCALFVGTINNPKEALPLLKKANYHDTCSFPIVPEWVTIDDIVNEKIYFDTVQSSLHKALINYCKSCLL